MPKIKDFEKDYDLYKKQAALHSFINKHYEFIKGKVSGGESLTAIFAVAQAMGFLKDFSLSNFQSAYHSHKARVEKNEKPAESAKTENKAGNTAATDVQKKRFIDNEIIKAAGSYARQILGDSFANEYANLVKACKPADEKTLRKDWLPPFEKMLKGIENKTPAEQEKACRLTYSALISFFKKEKPAPDVLKELPAEIQNLIEKRCPSAAVGGDLLNQSRG